MKRFLLLLSFLLTLMSFAFGQNNIADWLKAVKKVNPAYHASLLQPVNRPDLLSKYEDRIATADYYQVDWGTYGQFFAARPELINFVLPGEGGTMTLELFQVDLLSELFVLRTGSGKQLQTVPSVFYRGIVQGHPNWIVTASFYEHDFDIAIYANQVFRLDYLQEENVLAFFSDESLLNLPDPPVCQNDNKQMAVPSEEGTAERGPTSGDCVQIYVECDHALYTDQNSDVTQTSNYVTSLYSEVATIYGMHSIPLSISEIVVWDTLDPYAGGNSTGAVLDLFADHVQDNHTGRLCVLLSTRSLGGGIAWLNVLCANYNANNHSGPYAFCANLSNSVTAFPTYSWNVNVTSHEMGHNFGSNHTHECIWGPSNDKQIDDCGTYDGYPPGNGGCYDSNNPILPDSGGTIMSYCHLVNSVGINFNNGFGPEPGNLIHSKYVNATCTTGTACTPLPVELTMFEANKVGIRSQLIWQTVSERNNKGFELYRSRDGEHWEKLGFINPTGDGRGVTDYVHWDDNPLRGTNYYRLKQMDFDGRFQFSSIVSVTFAEDMPPGFYPNPARSEIRFSFLPQGGAQVTILDMRGRMLIARNVMPGEAIDISGLSDAVYWVRIQTSSQAVTRKLFVE